ncbi:hypothetical protein RIF25_04970 [Thermosynechococcaceae cyanobacterium BACA0444]|uniref:Uncharacterized protein n=1 Tax=Pseudocalidococcus azoricus BACA0444 TaxID=2918990 RepID=A0AAE4FRF3_9CYAN|nr:hypothetical protein [Pseudocalidococcus azoricus]MDS3860152.1 hypothetical protein [Pseudocalidococcus azoricus BACA0444]
MTYEQYINRLREQQDEERAAAELDREQFMFDDAHESEYWDCLECAAPPEVLEDTPQ